MNAFTLTPGHTPLLVSLPHVGVAIPEELQPAYVPRALLSEDSDRHLERLYSFVVEMGASLLVAHWSRSVIDLNRPPDDAPMYPGANNTELCPTRFFTGEPLYKPGCEPDRATIVKRREVYWQPYHDALSGEVARLKSMFGHMVLYDGHSIKSRLPWLFEGKLPDLNLGTADGASCSQSLREAAIETLRSQSEFSIAIDGRFKGGAITRRYGQPREGVHALQMEMCHHLYMNDEPPFDYREETAAAVRLFLNRLLARLQAWALEYRP